MNSEEKGKIAKKNAVIIQLINRNVKFYDLQEFRALALAANYEIIDEVIQNSNKINPKLLIGRGKAEQIAAKYANLEFDPDGNAKQIEKIERRLEEDLVFLFNNRLNSGQVISLSEMFRHSVIDRDLLILEIFELGARTKEALLQIKLARMGLEKARKQKEVSKQMADEKQGRDFMGKGYGAFEIHRKSYKDLRKKTMDELAVIRKNRANQRKSRMKNKKLFKISIVGYTNAGKTTLLNTLKKENFATKATAFTTTTTVSRRVEYFGETFIFTDTVGFVYDIPHEIIEAFLSTLEEASYSDSILMIIDISDKIDIINQKLLTTFSILSKIGALKIPIIYGINKIDKLNDDEIKAKKEFLDEILPKNSKKYYFSAMNKKEVFNLVKIFRMVKNKELIVTINEEFAENLVDIYNLKDISDKNILSR